ncbi:MAG TPA: hypothetical protein VNW97_09135 [Candidatus Saccharimonadales bacterium]|jgi:hypothetical protein|nr:hypothetical protein [Candidatus Saccharimonadales bacterium]
MGLQQKLNERKQAFLASGKVSPETIQIMHRSTEDLRASGIMKQALKIGDTAPQFQLPNQDGKLISSAGLLAQGPLVVSFFRGVW